jgi:hypothetical protein
MVAAVHRRTRSKIRQTHVEGDTSTPTRHHVQNVDHDRSLKGASICTPKIGLEGP